MRAREEGSRCRVLGCGPRCVLLLLTCCPVCCGSWRLQGGGCVCGRRAVGVALAAATNLSHYLHLWISRPPPTQFWCGNLAEPSKLQTTARVLCLCCALDHPIFFIGKERIARLFLGLSYQRDDLDHGILEPKICFKIYIFEILILENNNIYIKICSMYNVPVKSC
jgi:hypothetical protein